MSALPETKPLSRNVIEMYVGERHAARAQEMARAVQTGARVKSPNPAKVESAYAPPRTASSVKTKSRGLFSSAQIGLSSFLATPMAGGILLAINYSKTRQSDRAVVAVVGGVLLTAALIALGMFGLGALPSGVRMLPALGVAFLLRKANDSSFSKHLADQKAKGIRGSIAVVLGVSLCSLTVTAITVLMMVTMLLNNL